MADKLGECCHGMSPVGWKKKIDQTYKFHRNLWTHAVCAGGGSVRMTTSYKSKKEKVCDGWIDTIIFTEYEIIRSLGLIVSVMLLLYMLYNIVRSIYMHIYSVCQLSWALAYLKSKHVGWSFVYFKHAYRLSAVDLHCIWISQFPAFTLKFQVTFKCLFVHLLFYCILTSYSVCPMTPCKIHRRI